MYEVARPAGSGGARFRVALVGCGRIAEVHLQALRSIPEVRVAACCDLNESLARSFAERHGVPAFYVDVETMLREARPVVVHLLTPPGTHRPLVEACARARAHVYVEKPLASSEPEARALVEAARAAGIQVCPGHNRLFDPQFLELRRRVAAGEIGRVLSVRAEQGFGYESVARAASIPWSYAYDWGIYDNLMPHALYLVTHFLSNPGPPQVASFDLGQVREAAVEEIRALIPSDAAVGEVVLSMNAAPQRVLVEVTGTRGRMIADYVGLHVSAVRVSGMPGVVQRLTAGFHHGWQQARGSLGLILGVLTGRIKTYMGLRKLVLEFYRSLREGQPPPVTAEEGLINVRLMDQIRQALAGREKARVRPEGAPTPARALVTGATGFLGGRLVERLAEARIPTRATTRIAARARALEGVQWVRGNLASEEDLRRAMTGIETVFHCAAMAGAPGTLADYEEANIQGTLRVAKIAEELGVRNLIYVSSISVYALPSTHGPYLDEGAAYDARAEERGFYTQSKLGADRALIEHTRAQRRLRIVVLRPGTIYGPGVALPVGRLQLPSPFSGRPLVAGGGGVPMPLSYVDNVVDAMLAAEASDVPSGSVFNVVDDPEWNQGAVARALTRASQGRIRPLFVPYPLVWLMMLGVDVLAWVRRRQLGTARYRLARTVADMRYPALAARRQLGWTPRIGLEEGLAHVLARENPTPYPH